MSNENSEHTLLQFYPFSSLIDVSFWHTLANKKLEQFKLDDKPIDIKASFSIDNKCSVSPVVTINYDSFDVADTSTLNANYPLFGKLIVTNTIEDFANKDKNQLLQQYGSEIWRDIIDNNVIKDASHCLSKFLLLVYADLKTYKFHYWFAFPAVCFPQNTYMLETPIKLCSLWSDNMTSALYDEYHSKLNATNQSYFLIHVKNSELTVHPINDYPLLEKKNNGMIYFSFSDPCSSDHYPGWPLRNYLAYICNHFKLTECFIIAFRINEKSAKNSITFKIKFVLDVNHNIDNVNIVGWEKNEKNKLMPRTVDLGSALNPLRLAENAADLNLKLMKWRLVPSLNLEQISSTRCLLLGSGTLGCYVARALLSWGVKNITFVDNSNVSYSNPVRQALYTFADSVEGKSKSQAAAQALKTIYPNVNSCGINLSIPMPGHPVMSHLESQVEEDVNLLKKLISENDVIFLLMDTRESRWLPTLIASALNKLVINAALGFDSYLVLRHGIRKCEHSSVDLSISGESSDRCVPKKIYGTELGCYFCNDVVAPRNSTRDRTLDQQCTVTRPGVSMFASALAVELMVSVLQHPMGGGAPTIVDASVGSDAETETSLGIIPHQIRGFLSKFQQIILSTQRFNKCTACSDVIVDAYNNNGFELLLKAFNDSNYIEELTGLKQLHQQTDLIDIDIDDWTDDED